MTVRDGHAFCDGCPRSGPAVAHIEGEWFAEWETVGVGDGEAHLCPRCRDKRDRGLLAHDFVLICARCERTSLDTPKIEQWWGLPNPEPGTMSESVCDDCFDPDRDTFTL